MLTILAICEQEERNEPSLYVIIILPYRDYTNRCRNKII